MRFAERTLTLVQIAPRKRKTGALGGLSEAFSSEKTPIRASILPMDGALETLEAGARHPERLRILIAANAKAAAGDGVQIGDRMYRIIDVQRWAAHWELLCEAI